MRIKLILICITLMLLTGCWDSIELEELTYVIVIGFDKGEGETYKLRVTYQVMNPQGGGAGASRMGADEPPSEIVEIEAPDIISAQDLVSAAISRRLTFSQNRTIVVSE